MTTDTHHPPFWREHLIAVIGGHADPQKLRYLDAQSLAEWSPGSGLPAAKWNPLNSTFYIAGATAFNSFGAGGTLHVWNYPGPIAGVCATALTLSGRDANGALLYPKLLAHLQAPAGRYTAEQIVDDCAADIQRWGTDLNVLRRVLAESAA